MRAVILPPLSRRAGLRECEPGSNGSALTRHTLSRGTVTTADLGDEHVYSRPDDATTVLIVT